MYQSRKFLLDRNVLDYPFPPNIKQYFYQGKEYSPCNWRDLHKDFNNFISKYINPSELLEAIFCDMIFLSGPTVSDIAHDVEKLLNPN